MNDTTTLPAIGSPIETAADFDALPVGTVLTDKDGWLHTKVSNRDLPNGEQAPFTTTYAVADGETGTFFALWNWGATVTSYPEPETASRPVRALPHDTQRGYALKARSPKCLSDDHNDVLTAAGNGEEVDVFAFRQAATAALSLAATRAGQSMARRDWTREARALIHWADAILESHLDGLPVYAEGERSRKVEEMKDAVVTATEEVARLTAEVNRLTDVERLLEGQRDAYLVERDEAFAERDHAIQTALALADENTTLGRRVSRQVFNYALSLLSLDDQQRVYGYADGIKGATSPSAVI